MTHTQVNADFTAVVPRRALGYNPRTPAAVAQAARQGWYVREGAGGSRGRRTRASRPTTAAAA
jgi:hypothetical protein